MTTNADGSIRSLARGVPVVGGRAARTGGPLEVDDGREASRDLTVEAATFARPLRSERVSKS